MKKIAFLLLSVSALAACDPAQLAKGIDDVNSPEVSCFTRPQGGCLFDRNPLRVLPQPVTIPQRPYRFFPTAEPLTLVDAVGKRWVAPERTLTDGASIPLIFISIIGNPTLPEFRNAAAVHDAYCGIGNEEGRNFHNGTWQEVHRMFYDGLIVGGTNEVTAKVMFAAVWLGGPRWRTTRELDHVPAPAKQRALRRAKAYVEAERPSLPRLEAYLYLLEKELLNEYPRWRKGDKPEEEQPVLEDLVDTEQPVEVEEPTAPVDKEPTYPEGEPTYPGETDPEFPTSVDGYIDTDGDGYPDTPVDPTNPGSI